MNTGELLLRAVLCDPGDDTARLAFADYQEENGEADRSAFVRGMIDMEQCRPDCGVGRVCRGTTVLPPMMTCGGVRDRVTTLFDANLCRWESGAVIPDCAYRLPWRGTGDTAHVMAIYRRGLVGEVRLPAAAFTERFARELFSRHPVVKVVLTDREPAEDHRGQDPVRMLEYLWRFRSHRWDRRSAVGPSAWDVPPPLWPFAFSHRVYSATRRYATRDAAASALSAWCVAWGRSLAELPPLPHASGGA